MLGAKDGDNSTSLLDGQDLDLAINVQRSIQILIGSTIESGKGKRVNRPRPTLC